MSVVRTVGPVCFPWGEYLTTFSDYAPGDPAVAAYGLSGSAGIGTNTWSSGFSSQAADIMSCFHTHEDAGSGDFWPNSVWDFYPPGTCGIPAGTRYYREYPYMRHGQYHWNSSIFGYEVHADKWMKIAYYISLSDLTALFTDPFGGKRLSQAYPGDPHLVDAADDWLLVGDPMVVPVPTRGEVLGTVPSDFLLAGRKQIWADLDTVQLPDLGLSWYSYNEIPGGSPVSATIECRWDLVRRGNLASSGDSPSFPNPLGVTIPYVSGRDRQVAITDFVDEVIVPGSVFATPTLTGADSDLKVNIPVTCDLNLTREQIWGWLDTADPIALRIELNCTSDTITDWVPPTFDTYGRYGNEWRAGLVGTNRLTRVKPECVDVEIEYYQVPPLRQMQRDDTLSFRSGNGRLNTPGKGRATSIQEARAPRLPEGGQSYS